MHSDLDVHSLDVGHAGAKLCVSTMSDTRLATSYGATLGVQNMIAKNEFTSHLQMFFCYYRHFNLLLLLSTLQLLR